MSSCRKDEIRTTTQQEVTPPEIINFEEHFSYTQYNISDDIFIAEIVAQDPSATWHEATNTLTIYGSDVDEANFMEYTLAGITQTGEYYATDVEGLMFGEKPVLWCEEGSIGEQYDWCRSKLNITNFAISESFVEGTFYCTTPYDNDDVIKMEGVFKIALD